MHVGLNQLRKVVNGLVRRYGHPSQVVVELARELPLGKEAKEKLHKVQAENQRKNEARKEMLAELGERDTGENRLRLRLWEELGEGPHDRRCVYTGEPISARRLFSEEVAIDHILPRSKTLDDSAANRIVCFRRANNLKANRPPYEAFGGGPPGFDWNGILARADDLPKNKRWRFQPDAMERFEQDFLARHLVDTQYLARLTRLYLSDVCAANEVWVTPGR